MTKKQLVKWVESKRADALCAAREQHKKAIEKHTNDLYAVLGIENVANKIQALFNQADNIITAWKEEHKNQVTMCTGWQSIHDATYNYIHSANATYSRIIEREFRDTTENRKKIDGALQTLEREIQVNYANVLNNIQTLKDAKTGIEYLKELGFDVQELILSDEKPITALSVPVNKSFLFIAREES